MADYVTLLGAEQVQSAASTMADAAERMMRAADYISGSLERHRLWADDWLARFEQVVTKAQEPRADVVQHLGPDPESLSSNVLKNWTVATAEEQAVTVFPLGSNAPGA